MRREREVAAEEWWWYDGHDPRVPCPGDRIHEWTDYWAALEEQRREALEGPDPFDRAAERERLRRLELVADHREHQPRRGRRGQRRHRAPRWR
jgi:hypothetical protein